jgi:shikimate kinase
MFGNKLKQTVIFLVGSDRVGKSEIGKELSKRLKIPYFKAKSEHSSYLNKSSDFLMQLEHADPRIVDFVKQTKSSVIFDRGFPCEDVYSTVFDRETNREMLQYLDEEWSKMNALIVICRRSSYEGIVDDLDPENLNSEMLQKIDAAYVEFSRRTKCHTIMLNVDDEDLDREISDILAARKIFLEQEKN